MKFTQQEAVELLKGIGIADVEIVEADSDYNKDGALKTIDANRLPIIKPQLQKEIYDTEKAKVTGIVGDEIKKLVKKATGIDNEKLKDLEKWEEVLNAGLDHIKTTVGKDNEGVLAQMDEMVKKHNETLAKKEQEWGEKVNAAEAKFIDRDIEDYIQNVAFKDAPIKKDADRSILAKDYKAWLQSEYNLTPNQVTKHVELFMKDNPEMPVYNEDKTVRFNASDKLKEYLEPRGLWEKDTRNIPPDPNVGKEQYSQNNNNNNSQSDKDPIEAMNEQRERLFANT